MMKIVKVFCRGLSILIALLAIFIPICAYIMGTYIPQFKGMVPILTPSNTWNYRFQDIPDLSGKVAIVTGANVGLGFYTAKYLAFNNANTILACRSMEKCNAAVKRITNIVPKSSVTAMKCDLSSLKSVRLFINAFMSRYSQLDILVLNAGVMHTPYTLSADGLELQFAVNHLAHHFLATRLLPNLQASSFATVVSVSSSAHFRPYGANVDLTEESVNNFFTYDRIKAYGQSKLYNVLFAQEFANQVSKQSIYVNVIHPGGVLTNLFRHWEEALGENVVIFLKETIFQYLLWSPEVASLTQLYAATSPEILKKNIRGKYLVPIAQISDVSDHAKNNTLQKELWHFSEELISSHGF